MVPKMIRELVFALPPLGEARVLDLLCKTFFKEIVQQGNCQFFLAGSGACSVAVKSAYPRCRLSTLDKCQFRLNQCSQHLQRADTSYQPESQHNTEVRASTSTSQPVCTPAVCGESSVLWQVRLSYFYSYLQTIQQGF